MTSYRIHFPSILENTRTITERRDVSSSILFIHGLSSELFSNHITYYTQHSSTTVVKFYIKLTCFLFRVFNVRTKVTNTIVTIILGCRHPGEFDKSKHSQDLSKTSGWNSENSIDTSRNVSKLKVVGRCPC